jgi:hypothetical protein
VEGFVDPPRERGAHAGNGPEEPLGVQAPAEPVELAPASGPEHLDDRGGDPRPDTRERVEALDPLALVDLVEAPLEAGDRLGGLALGAHPDGVRGLLLEQIGGLAEPIGDELVRRGHGGAQAPRPASLTT